MKWTPEGVMTGDQFGRDSDVSGRRVIGGAHAAGEDNPRTLSGYATGAAYILDLDTQEETILLASDGKRLDQFGVSVGIDGDLAAVGAFGADGATGAMYVFEYDGAGNWVETEKFTPATKNAKEFLGEYVAVDGDTIVASAGGSHLTADPGFDRAIEVFELEVDPTPEEVAAVESWLRQIVNAGYFFRASAGSTEFKEARAKMKATRDNAIKLLAQKILGM
jgi:hypothetical protein